MRPPDHDARMERALLALDGLSVGDAFGERFFTPQARQRIAARILPTAPWGTTDDTEMALAIVEVLGRKGQIDRAELAQVFALRWMRDSGRGYGAGAHRILEAIAHGTPWQAAAGAAFGGTGSLGNGGAMRAAPVGAYFASDLEAMVREARASAEPTHAHPEGQAGAIAVAAAAAFAWRRRNLPGRDQTGADLLGFALAHTPEGETRAGIAAARALPPETDVQQAAHILGSGERVTSQDTVPFALWCAAHRIDDFPSALWDTVAGLGDRDTTCAIVGGIVALATGREGIPRDWLAAREPLHHDRQARGQPDQ
jgi:ADP-ribosylglycohydrolase